MEFSFRHEQISLSCGGAEAFQHSNIHGANFNWIRAMSPRQNSF
jgi:hypothetical protein